MMTLLRENWRWLLILSCMPLFATKTLFNLPVAIMMVLGGISFFRAPKAWLQDPAARLLLLIFLCFDIPMLLSLTDAVYLKRAASTALLDWRFFFAGIFVIEVLRDQLARRRLVWGVAIIGLAWSVDALLQMLLGYDLLGYPYLGERPTGIFHPNFRIGTVTATLSPILFEMIRLGARRRRWLWLGAPVVVAICIVSGNRNAWMMLTVSGLLYVAYLYFVLQRGQWLKMIATGLVAALVVTIGVMQYPPMQDRLNQTLGLFSDNAKKVDMATGSRLSLWKTAINMYRAHWINGVGPRGYRYAYIDNADPDDFWVNRMTRKQEYPQDHPHQMLLEVAAETGSIGLLGLAMMFFIYLRAALRAPVREEQLFWPWVIAVLVAWFPGNAHMAIYASYWSTIAWWILIVSIGMMGAGSKPMAAIANR